VAFLKRLWPDIGPTAPVNVQPVNGQVTAHLRRLWGLNHILGDTGEKNRADHRHHAVDALVVACAHPGVTQKLSRYWQMKDDPRSAGAQKPQLDPPWENIRADAEKAVAEVIVSHRVRKKVSGPLHDEKPFGNSPYSGTYSKRVAVEDLSLATLQISSPDQFSRSAKWLVHDNAVRLALLDHLNKHDGDPKKAYPPYPTIGGEKGMPIKKVRVSTPKEKDSLVEITSGLVNPMANHHISIYAASNGNAEFEIVSLFEASRRLAIREPVVSRLRVGCKFIMSLAPGDALEFSDGDKKCIRIVQGVWSSGQVVTRKHTDAYGCKRFDSLSAIARHTTFKKGPENCN
jgi:CRISPR-associated endonuclease Csn1